MFRKTLFAVAALAASVTGAHATTFTSTSPANGLVPAGISTVGGIVLDLTGANGTRVVSQLAASQLYVGYYNSGTPVAYQGNPGTIGIQTGFSPAIIAALGGGLTNAAVRFSLWDGDTAAGNFDFNDNTLLLNGVNFGNWSVVNAENTSSSGAAGGAGFSGGGFRNNLLDTGWFFQTDAGVLSSFFTTLSSLGQVTYQVNDVDPYDNYYDFTQGIDASLINVGTGPTVGPSVPEPASLALMGIGLAGVAFRRRKAA